MADFLDGARTLAWSAFLLLCFRAFTACVVMLVSLNPSISIGLLIQVHPASRNTASAAPNGCARSNSNGRDGRHIVASDNRIETPRPTDDAQPMRSRQTQRNDKFSVSPKQQSRPSHRILMQMYEEIIASDAETIEVQQATIHSQQEVIQSQREMIRKLHQLVDVQDAWIEDHVEEQGR